MALELTDQQERQWNEYRSLGTPEEIRSKRSELESDNKDYRDKLRTRDKDIEKLQGDLREARKSVPDGGALLDADQAKAWQTYQDLGKPEELKTKLEQRDELEQKDQERTRKELQEEAAKAAGYDPEVFASLGGIDQLEIEMRQETVEGEKVKVPFAKVEGSDPQKLTAYVEATYPEGIRAALAAVEGETRRTTTAAPRFPRQREQGKPPRSGAPSEDEFRRATRETADYTL